MSATYAQSMRGLAKARQARARNLRAAARLAVRRVAAWEAWLERDAQATRAFELGMIDRAALRRVRAAMPEVPTDHDYRLARGDA